MISAKPTVAKQRDTSRQDEDGQDMSNRMLDNLSTAVLLLNDEQQVAYINQAAESLLQESSAQLIDKCLAEVIANSDDLLDIVNSALESDQLITRRQMSLQFPEKESITADVTVTPILESGQALVELIPMDRYLRIDRDAALKEHHDITRQMVRGLAHEIKNPLGGIKGSAQLLERELPNEALKEYTQIVIEETDRLSSLVDRMLGPNTPPQKRLINIHEVLERIGKLIELEADESLTVIRDYDPSIPEISADPQLLLQALLNVARNAMQCLEGTPHPTIKLCTRIERQFTINGKRHRVALRIDITDNGPGIPEDLQEHVFYPMISGRPGGIGLGLTFVQSIIAQHQGMIEFSSQPGKTEFNIFVPLEQEP
jgi:two-component system nitrogen regulation sensor histidine kinase GlnL